MKRVRVADIIDSSHSLMNEVVVGTAGLLREAEIVFKLDELLKERNVSQKELSKMTGMRMGTISEIVNGKGISFNKVQILSIVVALRITSFNELFELRLPDQLEDKYKEQSKEWIESKEMPIEVKAMYKDNVLKASGLD